MNFSPAIDDGIPRALVIADGPSIVGHVGCTVSPFTDGRQSLRIVHPANWAVDPAYKAGVLAVRLLMEIGSGADLVMIIGGSEDTQRIVPKIGFEERLHVGLYVKVLRPLRYIRASDPQHTPPRNAARLGWYWLRRLPGLAAGGRQAANGRYQWRDMTGQQAPCRPLSPSVMRNALDPAFLAWIKLCPQGSVHLLGVYRESELVGHASVLLLSRDSRVWANVMGADVWTDDESAWCAVLEAVEQFLTRKQVTHVNAVGCYQPWCDALLRHGYVRLGRSPVRMRDKSSRFGNIRDWHLTAIEGDLGYLME
jgi:hypothetical protein